jgi:Tol biopolymer transport system component
LRRPFASGCAAESEIVLAGVVLFTRAPALSAANVRAQDARIRVNGKWIAYSTAPANDQSRRAGYLSGSDVFLIHQGGKPRLVAGRGKGEISNVCPAFSPNGAMLAFGREAPGGLAIRVVRVGGDGAVSAPVITLRVPRVSGLAPCPKWSSDSSRLAYLDTNRRTVVRGLDGSIRARRAGDPAIKDFNRGISSLVAPTGDLIARRSVNGPSCTIVVSRRNGSKKRLIEDSPCSYAIAEWSPDGRKLLVMKDMDGAHFAMIAVSVDAPFAATPVVAGIRVNHARSWPGYGDVSWQPMRPR